MTDIPEARIIGDAETVGSVVGHVVKIEAGDCPGQAKAIVEFGEWIELLPGDYELCIGKSQGIHWSKDRLRIHNIEASMGIPQSRDIQVGMAALLRGPLP